MAALRVATRSAIPSDPRPMSEAELQTQVTKLARDLGWGISSQAWAKEVEQLRGYGQPAFPLEGIAFHVRWSMGSDAGFPDLVLIRRKDKRLLFRELKRDGKNPTPRQAAVLELLTACGLDAAVWRPTDLERIGEELL
jgi:hypothetical protein